jgi:hypothetical protein
MHRLNTFLQRQFRDELLEPSRRVAIAEQVRGQRDAVIARTTRMDAA